ncbi:chondrolectin [Mugil cephalus]|uniref:chondrolectin n=1 Tax=Mugil cephalus TaxID=48193 RepID=UPI001FB678A0|nr:chondrolectin [Mugil cephalus]
MLVKLMMMLGVTVVMAVVRLNAARVMSGQTVCLGGPSWPCYKIAYFQDVSSRVAFREAAQACQMDGGSLLSIQSPEEQDHIQTLLQAMRSGAVGGSTTGSGGEGGGRGIADGDFWIGLTRVDDQSQQEVSNTLTSCPELYQWTDGSTASFRNWYFDEPSCGGEACVVMYHQPTALPGLGGAYLYQWNDDRCNMKHNFICKYEPENQTRGNKPEGRDSEETAGGGVVTQSTGSEEVPPQVTMAGASGMLLLYVVIPTIPLLLLILVASGTCCFQMLSRSKTTPHPSNLWISRTPKADITMTPP